MKKIAILSLVLVLLLAAVGVGYAKWSAELEIDGVIETGEVEVGFCYVECNDTGIDPGYDKDVGKCSAILLGEPADTIEIVMSNAYPCYGVDFIYDVNNLGTIPVKIESIKLVELSYNGVVIPMDMELEVCTVYGIDVDALPGPVIIPNPTPEELMGPDSVIDFDIHVTGLEGNPQIDPLNMGFPEGSDTVTGDLHVHVDQGAQENMIYDFKIQIVASQWNEVP
jgi:hypothetical protein